MAFESATRWVVWYLKNFLQRIHLPKSTLLMLVSAFSGIEHIRAAYRHAIEQQYRFFSYGDAMLLTRAEAT